MATNELYHHGIIGQKWGVKNGPPYPLGSSVKKGSKKDQQQKAQATETDELEKIVKRIELENKYVSLTAKETTSEKVLAWLAKTGSLSMQAAVKTIVSKQLASYINKLLNERDRGR